MCYIPRMDLAEIRRLAIVAMFSDDVLLEQLVLKGGNAVNLVYEFGTRVSMDVDFSLEGDFSDIEGAKGRIFRALKGRFGAAGVVVFDESFEVRPSSTNAGPKDRWGGYEVRFKLIAADEFQGIGDDIDKARREALVIGPSQQKVFKLQISKFEYCAPKTEVQFDDYAIYVYTPWMLAVEKLRAICQQMPEYTRRVNPRARARDFYDIHSIAIGAMLDFSSAECQDLVVFMFDAKEVPLQLIGKIPLQREFHRPDWPSVEIAVSGDLREFDFYFDFVVAQTKLLKSLWEE